MSYVRKLFESEGSSFSECVLSQRLIRAHRMLTDPRFAGRSITSVAFDAGFSDVSYFNRSFRRRLAPRRPKFLRKPNIADHERVIRTGVRRFAEDQATELAVYLRIHTEPTEDATVPRPTKIQYGLDCCTAKLTSEMGHERLCR
jgi:hypothetical protein